mmetsp:Transcript_27571/g.69516  ORF Transcript_27571/g.69516 Transcript_27571/m.69516 type:complete len:320 (+) Transcript_27571:1340-2299(+)
MGVLWTRMGILSIPRPARMWMTRESRLTTTTTSLTCTRQPRSATKSPPPPQNASARRTGRAPQLSWRAFLSVRRRRYLGCRFPPPRTPPPLTWSSRLPRRLGGRKCFRRSNCVPLREASPPAGRSLRGRACSGRTTRRWMWTNHKKYRSRRRKRPRRGSWSRSESVSGNCRTGCAPRGRQWRGKSSAGGAWLWCCRCGGRGCAIWGRRRRSSRGGGAEWRRRRGARVCGSGCGWWTRRGVWRCCASCRRRVCTRNRSSCSSRGRRWSLLVHQVLQTDRIRRRERRSRSARRFWRSATQRFGSPRTEKSSSNRRMERGRS